MMTPVSVNITRTYEITPTGLNVLNSIMVDVFGVGVERYTREQDVTSVAIANIYEFVRPVYILFHRNGDIDGGNNNCCVYERNTS